MSKNSKGTHAIDDSELNKNPYEGRDEHAELMRSVSNVRPSDMQAMTIEELTGLGVVGLALVSVDLGGPGSGNHGHAGRPGQRGGSQPTGRQERTREREPAGGKLLEQLRSGGFTYQPSTGKTPTDGYMVSVDKNHEFVYDAETITASVIDDYIAKFQHEFDENENAYLGGWFNEEDGMFYLDVSINVKNIEDAMKMAKENNQIAVFDISKFETIYTEQWFKDHPDTNNYSSTNTT